MSPTSSGRMRTAFLSKSIELRNDTPRLPKISGDKFALQKSCKIIANLQIAELFSEITFSGKVQPPTLERNKTPPTCRRGCGGCVAVFTAVISGSAPPTLYLKNRRRHTYKLYIEFQTRFYYRTGAMYSKAQLPSVIQIYFNCIETSCFVLYSD